MLCALVQVSRNSEKQTIATWTKRLGALGVLAPLICLAFDFQPQALRKLCELCWPSGFLLLAADGKFNLAIYSSSIAINALIWAGIGWVIGYGLSNRK